MPRSISDISSRDLKFAISKICERAEYIKKDLADLYVDPDLLHLLVKPKNQVIYGRRGTGKTHLFARINEYYRKSFNENKVLPISINISSFYDQTNTESDSEKVVIGIYIALVKAIIKELENFAQDNLAISYIDKVFSTKRKDKIGIIEESVKELKAILKGEPADELGKYIIEQTQKFSSANNKEGKLSVDAGLSVEGKPKFDFSLKDSLSHINLQDKEKKIQIIMEGLRRLNYNKISEHLHKIIDTLDLSYIAILIDEWSRLKISHQPYLAQMLRSTIIGGKKIFLKLACIPFHTQLSFYDINGQPFGYPIGQEIFVDADLDHIYNSHIDLFGLTVFLELVLQKHLGYTIKTIMDSSYEQIHNYFCKSLFENETVIIEAVHASAGIPRDFLRIIIKAYQSSNGRLPIRINNVRIGAREFFQREKNDEFLNNENETARFFENVFNRVCMPNEDSRFLVSSNNSNNPIVRELWRNRMIHLIAEKVPGFSNEEYKTYDIYAMDLGKFIGLTIFERGQRLFDRIRISTGFALKIIQPEISDLIDKLFFSKMEKKIKKQLETLYTRRISYKIDGLEKVLENTKRYNTDNCFKS
ncbi:MAG TPA: hypothetical protein VN703_02600 [Candidatus Sulfopaludibacter sp.]|nr:hypothetical protein [Candidatus Sulfopaludibacter sp.]